MTFSEDMFEPANCRIMRVEFQLLDLPGKLSEMTGKDPSGQRRKLFSEEDDASVATLPIAKISKGSFAAYFEEFMALKDKYSFNVSGYGRFAQMNNGYLLLKDVELFNAELSTLRQQVNMILMRKYRTSWQNEYIRRFNPRVKCGTYLLPNFFVNDKQFIRQLNKTFEDEIDKGRMDALWLLKSSSDHLLMRKSVQMNTAKDDACANYLERKLANLF